jgi:penicillin-binding protein 2
MIGQRDSLRYLQEKFYWLFTFFVFAILVLVLRISYLQILNGQKYRFISDKNSLKEEIIPGPRGQFLDREGKLLVDNRLELDLIYKRQKNVDPLPILEKVSQLTGIKLAELKKDFAKEVRQKETFATVTLIRDLPRDIAAKVEAYKNELEGVSVQTNIKRVYLLKENAAHVFGYTGLATKKDVGKIKYPGGLVTQNDVLGKYGIERSLDLSIRGREGTRYAVVDVHGRRLKKDEEGKILGDLAREVDAKVGPDVTLTIDSDLQEAAQLTLKDFIGAVVALNPNTGEILAMHSQPGFDPTSLSLNKSEEWERVMKNEFGPLRNKVIQDHFSPGSTFKIFTALAGLQAGIINPNENVYCTGKYRLGNKTFHCDLKNGHGNVNLRQAIQKSCNVYFYTMASRMPSVNTISDFAKHFGFGRAPNLGMEREAVGLMPDGDWKKKTLKQGWSQGETLLVSIGQSYTLTSPLQLGLAYSALVNGGKLFKPYLVSKIQNYDGKIIEQNSPKILDHVEINPDHLRRVKEGLYDVVNEPTGTGYRTVRSPLLKIAGKSGTVTVASFSEDALFKSCEARPLNRRSHAWFVGYAPEEKPEIVVAAFAMHACWGSVAAGPVVKAVIEKWYEKNKSRFLPVTKNPQAKPDLDFSTR